MEIFSARVAFPLVIEGAVAAGTILLAGATFWLGWQTKASVRQSLLARLDQLAPSVLIPQPEIVDTALARARVGSGDDMLRAGNAWPLDQFGEDSLGVRCIVSATNESPRSAMLRFVTVAGSAMPRVVPPRAGFQLTVTDRVSPSALESWSPRFERGEWSIIPPSSTLSFAITYWAPAREWGTEAQMARAGRDVERRRFVIEVKTEPASVLDRWEVEFYKLALWFDPAGRVIVASSDPTAMPAPFPGAAVTVGDMNREYPTRNRAGRLALGFRQSWLGAVRAASLRRAPTLFPAGSGRGPDDAEPIGSDIAEGPGPGGGPAAT